MCVPVHSGHIARPGHRAIISEVSSAGTIKHAHGISTATETPCKWLASWTAMQPQQQAVIAAADLRQTIANVIDSIMSMWGLYRHMDGHMNGPTTIDNCKRPTGKSIDAEVAYVR